MKESIATKQETMKAQEECICKRKASLDHAERDLEARIKAVDSEVETKADIKAQKAVERESARLYKEYNVKTGFVFATWGIVFLTGFIHALAVGFANVEWQSFWKAIGIAIANLTVVYWKLCFKLQQGEGIMWWGTSFVSLFLFLMPFIIIFVLIFEFLREADSDLFFGKLIPYFITVYLAVLPYLLPVLPSWFLYTLLVACVVIPGYIAVKKKVYW